jgi:hypothetical protein
MASSSVRTLLVIFTSLAVAGLLAITLYGVTTATPKQLVALCDNATQPVNASGAWTDVDFSQGLVLAPTVWHHTSDSVKSLVPGTYQISLALLLNSPIVEVTEQCGTVGESCLGEACCQTSPTSECVSGICVGCGIQGGRCDALPSYPACCQGQMHCTGPGGTCEYTMAPAFSAMTTPTSEPVCESTVVTVQFVLQSGGTGSFTPITPGPGLVVQNTIVMASQTVQTHLNDVIKFQWASNCSSLTLTPTTFNFNLMGIPRPAIPINVSAVLAITY